MHLQLKVMSPTAVVLEVSAQKVNVEAEGGARGFLPRHIDCVATLVPGILSYLDLRGQAGFVAIDGGVLVKKGQELLIAAPAAVHSLDPDQLEGFIQERVRHSREVERANRGTLARLEVALVRRLMELSMRTL